MTEVDRVDAFEHWLTDEAVEHAERALYDRWSAEGETTTKDDVRTVARALAEHAATGRGAVDRSD